MAKILIVDDAAFMRMSLKLMLEKNGYNVAGEAANGLEAVKLYKELQPNLVTMDITMPEMTGIEAVKLIKAINSKARILMVSAMGQESMVKDAIIAGATGFVVNPFTEEVVVKAVKHMGI